MIRNCQDQAVKAVLLNPFDKSMVDVNLRLQVTSGSTFAMRVLASADKDSASHIGVDQSLIRGMAVLEDLTNGDYIMVRVRVILILSARHTHMSD